MQSCVLFVCRTRSYFFAASSLALGWVKKICNSIFAFSILIWTCFPWMEGMQLLNPAVKQKRLQNLPLEDYDANWHPWCNAIRLLLAKILIFSCPCNFLGKVTTISFNIHYSSLFNHIIIFDQIKDCRFNRGISTIS